MSKSMRLFSPTTTENWSRNPTPTSTKLFCLQKCSGLCSNFVTTFGVNNYKRENSTPRARFLFQHIQTKGSHKVAKNLDQSLNATLIIVQLRFLNNQENTSMSA